MAYAQRRRENKPWPQHALKQCTKCYFIGMTHQVIEHYLQKELAPQRVPYNCKDCAFRSHKRGIAWQHRLDVHNESKYGQLERGCWGTFKDLRDEELVKPLSLTRKRKHPITYDDLKSIASEDEARYTAIMQGAEHPPTGKADMDVESTSSTSSVPTPFNQPRTLDSDEESVHSTCWKRSRPTLPGESSTVPAPVASPMLDGSGAPQIVPVPPISLPSEQTPASNSEVVDRSNMEPPPSSAVNQSHQEQVFSLLTTLNKKCADLATLQAKEDIRNREQFLQVLPLLETMSTVLPQVLTELQQQRKQQATIISLLQQSAQYHKATCEAEQFALQLRCHQNQAAANLVSQRRRDSTSHAPAQSTTQDPSL